MNLPSVSKLVVSLAGTSPRLALVSVAASLLAVCAGIGIYYGCQHPEAVMVVFGVYGLFALATLVLVRFALPFIEHGEARVIDRKVASSHPRAVSHRPRELSIK